MTSSLMHFSACQSTLYKLYNRGQTDVIEDLLGHCRACYLSNSAAHTQLKLHPCPFKMGSGGKRRHQEDAEGPCLSSSSSSSSLEGDAECSSPKEDTKCSHASSCVSKSKVHKATRASFTRIGGICVTCKRNKTEPKGTPSEASFLMCLACGLQFCLSHKETHFQAPRTNPPHCIFLELSSWALSCELCQEGTHLSPDSSKRLRDVFELVKRAKNTKKKALSLSSHPTPPNAKLPKVRGLSNLGNTCFFNAVMQCLTQSHPLLHFLDLHSRKGVPFKTGKILGGDVLNLQLEDSGPLTLSLAAFLKEMNSLGGKSGAINPSQLFGRISHRSPQFRGFHQEDSHELLRHLMEGVKTEEVDRQKTSVLKHYGLTDKASRANVGSSMRKKLQSCNRYTNYTIVDKLFGGHLVSTILCEVCHNSSQIFEPFLDISLPLIEEKPSRPNKFDEDEVSPSLSCFGTKKNSSGGETSVSKSKRKKDKKLAKKEMRRNKKNKRSSILEEIQEKEESPGEAKEEEEEIAPSRDEEEQSNVVASADPSEKSLEEEEVIPVENNNKIVGKLCQSLVNNLTEESKGKPHGPKDGNEEDDEDEEASGNDDDDWEWGTDSQDQEKDPVVLVEEEDPQPHEVEIAMDSHKNLSEDSGDSSNADVEDNIESSSLAKGDKGRSFSISQMSYHPDSLHLDPRMQELSRNVRRLSVQASAFEDISEKTLQEYTVTSDDNGNEVEEDMRVQNDWISRSLTSMAPRYTSRSGGECSVYSCLAQFTSPELLTGNNKWACDKCTRNMCEGKRSREERSSSSPEATTDEPKTVYSNASKQLSIFSPPFILTIHLKRFQQTMCSLRKINKHVDFPLVLDLAPFCSSAAVSMSTVAAGQEAVKYYLFGLVSHSGRLQGGHYTAYVKVRPQDCSKDFSRFYSSPAVKNDEINNLLEEIENKFQEYYSSAVNEHISRHSSEETFPENPEGNSEHPSPQAAEPPPYKWYHVSDSLVTEVSEERVLKSQAYILFYERFL